MDPYLEILRAALDARGWHLAAGEGDADLVARGDGREYALELRASKVPARRDAAQARLADAVLRAGARARREGREALAVIAAPVFSPRMSRALADYAAEFAPGVAWGLVDGRGRVELHRPGGAELRVELRVDAPRSPAVASARAPRANPFSDLGQWMLKVLLAPRVPERWLSAPRERIVGPSGLARLADVSVVSASKFLRALEAEGHLERRGREPHLVRLGPLLERWSAAARQPASEVGARFALPVGAPADQLRRALSGRAADGAEGGRACLALFAACDALELGFVRGAPVHLYLEEVSESALRELGLVPVERLDDAPVRVREPRFPESVFRGRVLADGARVADALQCWLDVAAHPARGQEQAEELARRLGLREWSA